VQQYSMLRKLAPEVLEKLKVPGDEAKLGHAQRRRRGRMTLSLALLLVPLVPKLQIKAMRQILARKMSMTEARTYVYKLAASKGVKVGKRMSDRDRFKAISTAVENCYHVAERYLTMPGAQINSLVRGATPNERRAVAGKLERLCESLLMLADEIHKARNA